MKIETKAQSFIAEIEKNVFLKSDSDLPSKIYFIYFNESPLKITKNAFYFV